MYKKLLGSVKTDSGALSIAAPEFLGQALSVKDSLTVVKNEDKSGRIGEVFYFLPGLGDGEYQIVGTFEDVYGWGDRLISLELILVSREELAGYNKLRELEGDTDE